MENIGIHRSKRNILCVCVWVRVQAPDTGASKKCVILVFSPRRTLKQRRYSSTFRSRRTRSEHAVTEQSQAPNQRGGKTRASQMVPVGTSFLREFPATLPCLSPLDYLLVQELPLFHVCFPPTSVIGSC